jgi:hypothetical protein
VVAELVDALDSGSSIRKDVWVQVPSSAPHQDSLGVTRGFFMVRDRFNTTIIPRLGVLAELRLSSYAQD